MIKRIQGKDSSSHIQLLKIYEETTATEEINKMGEKFAFNSSSANYYPEFKHFKRKTEQKELNFYSDNAED